MKRMLAVEELARDARFNRIRIEDTVFDPRNLSPAAQRNGLATDHENASENARGLMHGIFVGEIQASRAPAARAGTSIPATVPTKCPFALKLDMARQCWDEARHVEISLKLADHMGSEIGEFAEQALLFEAACNPTRSCASPA